MKQFKSIIWTLLIIILIFAGFYGYIKLFDEDLAKKFSNYIHKQELECPVCEECEICEECPPCQTQENQPLDRQFQEEIIKKLDSIQAELQNIKVMQTSGVVTQLSTKEQKQKEQALKQLQENLKLLENLQ